MSAPTYDYETVPDLSVRSGPTPGVHYRVRHIATDSRVATCILEVNARLVVAALNSANPDYLKAMEADLHSDAARNRVP